MWNWFYLLSSHSLKVFPFPLTSNIVGQGGHNRYDITCNILLLPITVFLQPRNTGWGVLPSVNLLFYRIALVILMDTSVLWARCDTKELLSLNSAYAVQWDTLKCWIEEGNLCLSCLDVIILEKNSIWHSDIWTAFDLFKGCTFQPVFVLLFIATVYVLLGISKLSLKAY